MKHGDSGGDGRRKDVHRAVSEGDAWVVPWQVTGSSMATTRKTRFAMNITIASERQWVAAGD